MVQSGQKFGYNGGFGLELIIDLKGCDLSDLSKQKLTKFMVELCDRIKMVGNGEPIFLEDKSGVPHLHGISAIQLIETSNITCHPLPMLWAVYLNIFSCKEFDTDDALKFCMDYWKATSEVHTVLTRN